MKIKVRTYKKTTGSCIRDFVYDNTYDLTNYINSINTDEYYVVLINV